MPEAAASIILLAHANDRLTTGGYLRNLVSELRGVRRRLQDSLSKEYQIAERPNATLEDLLEVFDRNESRVQIFHYAGHADSISLMLEGAGGGGQPVSLEGFTRQLATQKGLKLVFLNGCSTAAHALALNEAGIPAVIATSQSISDEAAMMFAERFYERLADRKTIAEAFHEAEVKVQSLLMNGQSYRALYRDDAPAEEFPWKLFGKGGGWRLPAAPARGPGALAPLLCDRERQVESFRDSLDEMLAGERKIRMYLIHGRREDRHRSLALRLREEDIRRASERLYGKNKGLVHAYEVKDWPATGDLMMRQRNLQRGIARALDIPGLSAGEMRAADLADLFGQSQGILVFQHLLSADKWDNTTLRLIEWYVQGYWRTSEGREMPPTVIFLMLIYPEDEPGGLLSRLFGGATARQRIKKDLYDLAGKSSGQLEMLGELEPIPYSDVVEWVEENYPEELSELPEELYGGDTTRLLSMDVVEKRLKQEVEQLERDKMLGELFDNPG
ncbi:MAG: CHAT domain-containing protein [Bacteroidetes bacterium]|nr:MAG: CHAT domain-containing protein [Bacteroidota bacterium]